MARQREFNTGNALQKAMQVLWAKGYKATSLQDLTAAMGISKSSFYETFGGKHELFLSALKHYDERTVEWPEGVFEGEASARLGITNIFNAAIGKLTAANSRRGCLLGSSAIEVSPHDPDVEAAVNKGLARISRAFHRAVKRGQKEDEISSRHDPRSLARFLLGSINGLQVIGKANPDRAVLEDIARVTMAALD
ncbi:MAG TPA: TetR/AcrR family transcriptional regulator [Rhodospirillales bacterium]|jgi:TetR/AcrR family transcriptional repressor of nem operon|nr:TetR/AcrR family transcriptional regulator [Rhodospirillales bacterium]